MTDAPGSDRLPDQPLRLTATEQIVLERLEHEERDADRPRLARTYRRLIELSRSDDHVDAVLAAHLLRELLFVLPVAASVPVERGHTDYEAHADAIAESWPGGLRDKAIPAEAVARVRAMLEEHEQASRRATAGPDAFIRGRDPGRATYVPDASVVRWRRLSSQGTGYAWSFDGNSQACFNTEAAYTGNVLKIGPGNSGWGNMPSTWDNSVSSIDYADVNCFPNGDQD